MISSCLFWAQSRTDWRVRAQNSGVMPPTDRPQGGGGQGPPHVSLSQSGPQAAHLPPFDKQANTDTGQETRAISLHLQPSPIGSHFSFSLPVPGHR